MGSDLTVSMEHPHTHTHTAQQQEGVAALLLGSVLPAQNRSVNLFKLCDLGHTVNLFPCMDFCLLLPAFQPDSLSGFLGLICLHTSSGPVPGRPVLAELRAGWKTWLWRVLGGASLAISQKMECGY